MRHFTGTRRHHPGWWFASALASLLSVAAWLLGVGCGVAAGVLLYSYALNDRNLRTGYRLRYATYWVRPRSGPQWLDGIHP